MMHSYSWNFIKFCTITIMTIWLSCINAQTVWKQPDTNLPYHKVCFLTAHNAFSNKPDKWRYKQQIWSIEQQLNNGVRGLMLDIHECKRKILLCHFRCRGVYGLQKRGAYKTLQEKLTVIKNWLNAHPNEVITIFLENYVTTDHLLKDVIESIQDLPNLILTKNNWKPIKHKSKWPTLKWLIEQNKRLVIFNDNIKPTGSSDYTFYEWDHVIENQYGTFNMRKASCERKESATCAHKKRRLYLLNYFGTITASQKSCKATNSCNTLIKLIKTCYQNKFTCRRMPNFIALDHVHKGNAIELVNLLNTLAVKNFLK